MFLKRQDIIQAATLLFAEQGFGGTTTLQISKKARITEPVIYYHFTGKDQLFTRIISIILCTGYSEHINEDKAKRSGIRAFVVKPVVLGEIANTTRKVLDDD